MPTVLAILPEGFEEIEAVAPIDLLRRAGCQVTVAALGPNAHVTGRCNITMHADMTRSLLHRHFCELYVDVPRPRPIMLEALRVPCIAEKALCYLFAEQNLLTREQLLSLLEELQLDREYLLQRLRDNRRPIA